MNHGAPLLLNLQPGQAVQPLTLIQCTSLWPPSCVVSSRALVRLVIATDHGSLHPHSLFVGAVSKAEHGRVPCAHPGPGGSGQTGPHPSTTSGPVGCCPTTAVCYTRLTHECPRIRSVTATTCDHKRAAQFVDFCFVFQPTYR